MNELNDRNNEAMPPRAMSVPPLGVVDPRIIEHIALNGCPSWTQEIISALPEEADTTPAAPEPGVAEVERIHAPRYAPTPPVIAECPLHTAMRHLTEAAVAQHVLYLEGEVRPRPDLVNAIERWERMHTFVRECVCPATRLPTVSATALSEVLDATVDDLFEPEQHHLRTRFVQALEACATCVSTAQCPLGAVPGTEQLSAASW